MIFERKVERTGLKLRVWVASWRHSKDFSVGFITFYLRVTNLLCPGLGPGGIPAQSQAKKASRARDSKNKPNLFFLHLLIN